MVNAVRERRVAEMEAGYGDKGEGRDWWSGIWVIM